MPTGQISRMWSSHPSCCTLKYGLHPWLYPVRKWGHWWKKHHFLSFFSPSYGQGDMDGLGCLGWRELNDHSSMLELVVTRSGMQLSLRVDECTNYHFRSSGFFWNSTLSQHWIHAASGNFMDIFLQSWVDEVTCLSSLIILGVVLTMRNNSQWVIWSGVMWSVTVGPCLFWHSW